MTEKYYTTLTEEQRERIAREGIDLSRGPHLVVVGSPETAQNGLDRYLLETVSLKNNKKETRLCVYSNGFFAIEKANEFKKELISRNELEEGYSVIGLRPLDDIRWKFVLRVAKSCGASKIVVDSSFRKKKEIILNIDSYNDFDKMDYFIKHITWYTEYKKPVEILIFVLLTALIFMFYF